MKLCGRALIFGDASTVEQYRNNPKFSVHGPGFSKVLIGEDQIEQWPEYIDIIAQSIADNGGRSCVNASAVVVPRYGAEIADALARKLGPVVPEAPESEDARLSGFANPKMADFIDGAIEDALGTPGATDVTAKYRGGPRRVEFEGAFICGRRSCIASRLRIRFRTASFCVRTRVWWRCRRIRCWRRWGRRWWSRRSLRIRPLVRSCWIPR